MSVGIKDMPSAKKDRYWQQRPFPRLRALRAGFRRHSEWDWSSGPDHRVTDQSGQGRLPMELVQVHNLWTFSALQ
jgi:hypothetical protein